jgi:hypothetical protein
VRKVSSITSLPLLLCACIAHAGTIGPFTRVGGPVTDQAGHAPLVPLHVEADPTVISDAGLYKMWFTTGDTQNRTGLAYATSSNGTQWSMYHKPANPDPWADLVLTPTSTNAWNGLGIETGSALRGPDGVYRMYFTGDKIPAGTQTYAIGQATSTDGIHWTQRSSPVFQAQNAWERCTGSPCSNGGVLEPTVMYDAASGQYKMWYAALGTPPGSFLAFRIGYATSADGINWTRQANPVLNLGGPGAWDEIAVSHVNVVKNPDGGFDMFYYGGALKDYQDGADFQRGSIGHAHSADGINWVKDARNPVLAYQPGQWDNWMVGGPSALFEGHNLKLWYFGTRDSTLVSDIALATAVDPPEDVPEPGGLWLILSGLCGYFGFRRGWWRRHSGG